MSERSPQPSHHGDFNPRSTGSSTGGSDRDHLASSGPVSLDGTTGTTATDAKAAAEADAPGLGLEAAASAAAAATAKGQSQGSSHSKGCLWTSKPMTAQEQRDIVALISRVRLRGAFTSLVAHSAVVNRVSCCTAGHVLLCCPLLHRNVRTPRCCPCCPWSRLLVTVDCVFAAILPSARS